MQKDFGDNRDYFSEVRPLASYAYRAERLGADVGIFSRDELRGDYSHAFFNDSLRVYDPTIQGMAVRYRNPKGLRAELVLNWEGMYSEYSREKFRIFGAIHKDWSREADKRWYVGGGLSMFHFANSALTEGNVVDNMLANPYVGFASKRWCTATPTVGRRSNGLSGTTFAQGSCGLRSATASPTKGGRPPWAANCACVWAGRGSNSRTTSM